jgi:hypothetical protein
MVAGMAAGRPTVLAMPPVVPAVDTPGPPRLLTTAPLHPLLRLAGTMAPWEACPACHLPSPTLGTCSTPMTARLAVAEEDRCASIPMATAVVALGCQRGRIPFAPMRRLLGASSGPNPSESFRLNSVPPFTPHWKTLRDAGRPTYFPCLSSRCSPCNHLLATLTTTTKDTKPISA